MDYRVFGYGSLLSHRSLAETIPDRAFTPAFIRGYRRIFNYREENDRDPDMLNLHKDGRAHVNGVVLSVTERELEELKKREDVYNLEPVTAYDYTSHKRLGECLTSVDSYIRIDHANRLPDKRYFIMCREAAYALGDTFGKTWDETTYTAGGERMSEWLVRHPEYETLH